MADAFLGEVRLLPYTYTPDLWAPCNGQLLSVQQYSPLFSLLGVRYGGDGRTTFGLPNLNGRVPVGVGQAAPGGRTWALGQQAGVASVTLTPAQTPSHGHFFNARVPTPATAGSTRVANAATPRSMLSRGFAGTSIIRAYDTPPAASTTPVGVQVSATFGPNAQAHSNLQPYLAMAYCICIDGAWPMRPD